MQPYVQFLFLDIAIPKTLILLFTSICGELCTSHRTFQEPCCQLIFPFNFKHKFTDNLFMYTLVCRISITFLTISRSYNPSFPNTLITFILFFSSILLDYQALQVLIQTANFLGYIRKHFRDLFQKFQYLVLLLANN